jgi:hypothetical protein
MINDANKLRYLYLGQYTPMHRPPITRRPEKLVPDQIPDWLVAPNSARQELPDVDER